jgi:tetratricopeptide (TPR) repeat protein
MAPKRRWLLFLLMAVGFIGLVLTYAWVRDPHFYLTSEALFRRAQEAENQGDLDTALKLAHKAWQRQPGHTDCGTFLGWLYLKQNKLEPARDILGQVWERDPKATGALKGLAQALNQTGERPQALKLLADYLQENPQDGEVLLFAAQLAGQQDQDNDLALEFYQRHYRLQPTPEVRRTLVDLLSGSQRYKEAIPLQEEEAAQNPDQPEALHRLALLHYWSRDYDAATQVYQRLLEQAAENAAFRQEAAQAAAAAQNLDEALKNYLWLYAHSKGQKEHALPLARLWSQKGNHAEAAAVLAALMDDQPDPDTVRWYALELLLTGNLDKAHQVYKKAWEKGDSHQETIINLARLYGRQRQFSRAAAMWDEAQRRQLIQGELRWEAALTYSYAQRFSEAINILKPLERDNPKYPRLRLFLGQMHFYQKHWGQAAHYFRGYLEDNPEDLTARQLLAEALAFQPKAQDEALEAYGDLTKRTDDVGLRLRRITLLLKAKRWEEAKQELQDCPMPQEPQLLKEQARLLLWAGDLDGALDRYDRFLKLEPQDREALIEKSRVLIYLGRAPEAQEILRRLKIGETGARGEQPEDRVVLVALIQAALAQKDWQEASHWALRLYGAGWPEKYPRPRTWPEARQQLPQKQARDRLSLEERTWIARALGQVSDPEASRLATDLVVDNLWENRRHHASLLILSYLLPKLSRYEDLSRLIYRVPGIKVDSPEYVAAVSFFSSKLGRHGGKLDYLLHVLKQYRRGGPDSPGECLALADLAMELGDRRAAENYYRRAQRMWPQNERLAHLLRQCQMVQKDWGKVLATLNNQPLSADNALEIARLYLLRGQYEGVKAAAAQVPPEHASYPQVQLLKVQACRLQKSYPEALQTLETLSGLLPPEELLMEKARILEGMGDRRALACYAEIITKASEPRYAKVAEARRARAAGNLGGASVAFAQALKHDPQNVELLNELEDVRQRQRPELTSRALAYTRGTQAEENLRPWQFSRPDREVYGGLPSPGAIPVLQPETLWFRDSNHLYGWLLRATAGFWATKAIPVQVAVEYRGYRQIRESQEQGPITVELDRLDGQATTNRSRLRLADLTVGVGPLHLADRLKLSGELIFRQYWKRVDREIIQKGAKMVDQEFVQIVQEGAKWYPFPPPPHLINVSRIIEGKGTELAEVQVIIKGTQQEHRDRLLGSIRLDFPLGLKTDGSLRFARRDLFDVDPALFPRLYQSINNLGDVPLITLNQLEAGVTHHFSPKLTWQGSLSGSVFSDDNTRFSLYQGLIWLPIKQSRMQLALTPHYYLTKYNQEHPSYFSPKTYQALGLTLDFYRQVYRLPTLVLQASVQGINQHNDWGLGFHGLAALEMEPVKNFIIYPHMFYFREWVDDYHIFVMGLSLRYVF